MKKMAFIILLSGFITMPVFADASDIAWIKQCISDNQNQGQSATTIQNYCTCMNGKMTSAETLSITAWSKSHKTEEEACAKDAGWVGR